MVADETGSQAKDIKRSIEKALGLPVLQRAAAELKDLQRSMSKNWQTQAKKNRNLEVLIRNLVRHESDLTSKNTEKTTLEDQIEAFNFRISELDDQMEKASKDLGLTERKKLLNEEYLKNKKEISEIEDKLKVHIAGLWREPLREALHPFITKIKADIAATSSERRNAELAFGQINDLEKALEISICSQCGSELGGVQHLEIKAKLDAIKSASPDSASLNNKIATLQAELSGIAIDGMQNDTSVTIRTLTATKTKLFRRNIKIEDETFEIRNDLADFDEENGRKIKNEYRVKMKEVGRLTAEILKIDAEIEQIEIEIKGIKTKSRLCQRRR